jgi:hypothetical protein
MIVAQSSYAKLCYLTTENILLFSMRVVEAVKCVAVWKKAPLNADYYMVSSVEPQE